MKHPEFLKVGQRLVFREGRTKAVGNVTKVIPRPPTTAEAKAAGKATRNEQRNRAMQKQQQQQVTTTSNATPEVVTAKS